MKQPMNKLGLLLLSILLIISIGSLILFLSTNASNIVGIGLGVVLVFVILTFISYLLYDLYSSITEDSRQSSKSSRGSINAKYFKTLSDA